MTEIVHIVLIEQAIQAELGTLHILVKPAWVHGHIIKCTREDAEQKMYSWT